MKNSFYLAWRYLSFNKLKSVILIVSLTLIIYLPLSLHILVNVAEKDLGYRAQQTPLLVGAKGSQLDLVLNALYFTGQPPEEISMEATEKVASASIKAIPLYLGLQGRGSPIVATTRDYFHLRQLKVTDGRLIKELGECILGWKAAKTLGTLVGGSLISSPESPFDLSGTYPVKMTVVGVLKQSHTADDNAIFIDLKTAWIIKGLGHGHEEKSKHGEERFKEYTEITSKNRESFHMHGELHHFPITAVIAVPNNQKSSTLLMGSFLDADEQLQIVKPTAVINSLLQDLFKFKNVLVAVIIAVAIAMALMIVLVMMLSQRVRASEMETMHKLGCSRLKIAELVISELLIVFACSTFFAMALLYVTKEIAPQLIRYILS